MTLGEKLYTLRTKQNMTQEQLAEKLQVSRQSISKWESDATRPDLGKLKFLAEFYHVSLDALLDEDVDIFADKTISALNESTNTASDKNESVGQRSATDSAFTDDNGNPGTGNTDNHSSYSVSPKPSIGSLLRFWIKITNSGNGQPSDWVVHVWHSRLPCSWSQ